jgi:aryl-alcohol dehydrogenase-like predicted oxidoreductase
MATQEGTERYRKRFDGKIPAEHFRQAHGVLMSSIGIGSYLGNYDDATDQEYHQAVVHALQSGCNVIDSAINYRLQRSERSIGTALKELRPKATTATRSSSPPKADSYPTTAHRPKTRAPTSSKRFIKPGLAAASDIVSGCHCMTPKYLLNQLDCSLRNLDLESIDIYYLHNPETQLGKITQEEFDARLLKAFETLEGAVSTGKIRIYGTATWNCFRNPVDAKDYLSLAHVIDLGRKSRRQAASLQSNSAAAQPRHERSAVEPESAAARPSAYLARSRARIWHHGHVQRVGLARTAHTRPAADHPRNLYRDSKPTASARCNLFVQRQA